MTKDYVNYILASAIVWGVLVLYPAGTLYLLVSGYREWRGKDYIDKLVVGLIMLLIGLVAAFAFWYWLLPDRAGVQ